MINQLTIRVYGFLIDVEKGLLVSDEIIQGKYFTKLPGGGLELGEGTRDCLKREFLEETGVEVTIGDHIYTTDYYQPSAFRDHQQFMGIYYYVKVEDTTLFKTHTKSFDFDDKQKTIADAESLRWIALSEISTEIFPLPTDKIAIEIVLKQLQNL